MNFSKGLGIEEKVSSWKGLKLKGKSSFVPLWVGLDEIIQSDETSCHYTEKIRTEGRQRERYSP